MATASAPIRARQPDSALAERYRKVRAHTERLCQPLKTEDYVVGGKPGLSAHKKEKPSGFTSNLALTSPLFQIMTDEP